VNGLPELYYESPQRSRRMSCDEIMVLRLRFRQVWRVFEKVQRSRQVLLDPSRPLGLDLRLSTGDEGRCDTYLSRPAW
jgi:hypothetical protein